jgi:anti-anti-sigma factor
MAADPLVVKQVANGPATVIELSGRLDVETIPLAQDKLAEAVAAGLPIVLDLARLSHLSSAGLRLILKTLKQAQATRQPLLIAGARGPVKDILDSIGLAQFCPMVKKRADALAKLG